MIGINGFEQMLTEKVSQLEDMEVRIDNFSKYLSGDGEVWHTYISISPEYEISAIYKGSSYYGYGKIKLEFSAFLLLRGCLKRAFRRHCEGKARSNLERQ
jgi:hypothetical protein